MTRTSRNFYSSKFIMTIPVRVRRKLRYLSRFVSKNFDINNNMSEEFFKTKYNTGADIFFDKDPLPNIYYQNEITLLPKNINTIFAFWEIKDDTFNHLKECFDVFDNATIYLYKNDVIFRKITNLPRVGSYYVVDLEADKEYSAVIGLENEFGDFFEISKSNKALAPSGKISDNIETIWGISKLNHENMVTITQYTKDFLPSETYFRQEILDNELIYTVDGEAILKFSGSSEKFIGSSEN